MVRMLILQVRHSEAYLTSAWAYLASVRFEDIFGKHYWDAFFRNMRFEDEFSKHQLACIFDKRQFEDIFGKHHLGCTLSKYAI